MLLVRWPRPKHSNDRAMTENALRCCFAHLKRILRLGRLQLHGPRGAQFEFILAAIAQNLRRLAKLAGRPPPLALPAVAYLRATTRLAEVRLSIQSGLLQQNLPTGNSCIATIGCRLFDQLIGASKQPRWQGKFQCFRSLEIDNELKSGGKLYR